MFLSALCKARKGLTGLMLSLVLVSFGSVNSSAQASEPTTEDNQWKIHEIENHIKYLSEYLSEAEKTKKEIPSDIYDILTSYSFDITLEYPNGLPQAHRLVQVMGVTQPKSVFELSSEPFMYTNDQGNIRTNLVWPYFGKNVGDKQFIPSHVDVALVYMDYHGSDYHWLAIDFNSTDGKDWKSHVEVFNCSDKRPFSLEICTHKPAAETLVNYSVSQGGEAAQALEHAVYGSNYRPYNRFVLRKPSVTIKMNIRLPKD